MNESDGSAARQDRRAAARKSQILESAASVFAQKGYPRATTAEIAARAGVSEGTIYNYFDSKHDLLVGIMAELAAALPIDSLPGHDANAMVLFQRLLRGRRQFEEVNGAMLKVVTSEVLVDAHLAGHYHETLLAPMLAQLEDQFQSCQDLRRPAGVDPALAARLLSALFTGLFVHAELGDALAPAQYEDLAVLLSQLFSASGV